MRAIVVILMLTCVSCQNTSTIISDQITGHWEMKTVMQNGQDVTSEHNPSANRFIIFNADQSFESGGDPYGRNTGRWTFDETTKELYLDSDSGEDDDSYWIVSMKNNNMYWQGARFEFSSQFAITHTRNED